MFKKHAQSDDDRKKEAMAAASVARFNPFELRSLALEAKGEAWAERDRSLMGHYIITSAKENYTIRVLRANVREGE